MIFEDKSGIMLTRTLLERLYYTLFGGLNIQVKEPVTLFLLQTRCVLRYETDCEGKENHCESKIISKTDLREMQNY